MDTPVVSTPAGPDVVAAKEPYPVIFQLECKGCGRCVSACPKKRLVMRRELGERGYPSAEYVGSGCIGCGACYYTCPEPGAIEVHPLPQATDASEGRTDTIDNAAC